MSELTPEQTEQVWNETNAKLDHANVHMVGGRLMWLPQSVADYVAVRSALADTFPQVLVIEGTFGQVVIPTPLLLRYNEVQDIVEQALFDCYADLAARKFVARKWDGEVLAE